MMSFLERNSSPVDSSGQAIARALDTSIAYLVRKRAQDSVAAPPHAIAAIPHDRHRRSGRLPQAAGEFNFPLLERPLSQSYPDASISS